MDKINFTASPSFPLSTNVMAAMQDMIFLAFETAKLGGSNYILSGCKEDINGEVSSGVIVINGEMLPFVGGKKNVAVTIRQTYKKLGAFGKEYPEAQIFRVADFADNGEYNWDDFKQVLTNQQLEKMVENAKGRPYGMVEMFVGYLDKIPNNYRLCDGQFLDKERFPELYNVIGSIYGSSSPTNFALPDMRQKFLVGFDNGYKDYNQIGKTGGEQDVILTENEIPTHYHKYSDDTNALGKFQSVEPGFPQSVGEVNETKSSGSSTGTGTVYKTTVTGGGKAHENRPPFFTLAYIIRVSD